MCHFVCALGDADFLKPRGELLLESFMDPIVIRHSKGHVVPKLGNFPTLCAYHISQQMIP